MKQRLSDIFWSLVEKRVESTITDRLLLFYRGLIKDKQIRPAPKAEPLSGEPILDYRQDRNTL